MATFRVVEGATVRALSPVYQGEDPAQRAAARAMSLPRAGLAAVAAVAAPPTMEVRPVGSSTVPEAAGAHCSIRVHPQGECMSRSHSKSSAPDPLQRSGSKTSPVPVLMPLTARVPSQVDLRRSSALSAVSAGSPRSSVFSGAETADLQIPGVDRMQHISNEHCICGSAFADDALFCRHCGMPRNNGQASRTTQSSTPGRIREVTKVFPANPSNIAAAPQLRKAGGPSGGDTERVIRAATRQPATSRAASQSAASVHSEVQAAAAVSHSYINVATPTASRVVAQPVAVAPPQRSAVALDEETIKSLVEKSVTALLGERLAEAYVKLERCNDQMGERLSESLEKVRHEVRKNAEDSAASFDGIRHQLTVDEACMSATRSAIDSMRLKQEELDDPSLRRDLAAVRRDADALKEEVHPLGTEVRYQVPKLEGHLHEAVSSLQELFTNGIAEVRRACELQARLQEGSLQNLASRFDAFSTAFDTNAAVQVNLEAQVAALQKSFHDLAAEVSTQRAALNDERSERLAGEKSSAEGVQQLSNAVLKEAQARAKTCSVMEEALSDERAARGEELSALKSQLQTLSQAQRQIAELSDVSDVVRMKSLEQVRAELLARLEEKKPIAEDSAPALAMLEKKSWDLARDIEGEREARCELSRRLEETLEARLDVMQAALGRLQVEQSASRVEALNQEAHAGLPKQASSDTSISDIIHSAIDNRLEAWQINTLRPLERETADVARRLQEETSFRQRSHLETAKTEEVLKSEVEGVRSSLQTLMHEVEALKRRPRTAAQQAELDEKQRCESSLAALRESGGTARSGMSAAEQADLVRQVETLKARCSTIADDVENLSESYTRLTQREADLARDQDSKLNAEVRERITAHDDAVARISVLEEVLKLRGASSSAPEADWSTTVRRCSDEVNALREGLLQETEERKALDETMTQRVLEVTEALRTEVRDRARGDELNADRLNDALQDERSRVEKDRAALRTQVTEYVELALQETHGVLAIADRLTEVERAWQSQHQELQRSIGRESDDRVAADARIEQSCHLLQTAFEAAETGQGALLADFESSLEASSIKMQALVQDEIKAAERRMQELAPALEVNLAKEKSERLAGDKDVECQLIELRRYIESLVGAQGRASALSDWLKEELEARWKEAQDRRAEMMERWHSETDKLNVTIASEVGKERCLRQGVEHEIAERLKALEDVYEEVFDLFRDGLKGGNIQRKPSQSRIVSVDAASQLRSTRQTSAVECL
mmetsp:Transcript_35621/g.83308  ORF Transcript_35621/g.83308 Transcript_35621/m.83308 type:complete len:1251 (-) Transcript_35621:21-3773(-)